MGTALQATMNQSTDRECVEKGGFQFLKTSLRPQDRNPSKRSSLGKPCSQYLGEIHTTRDNPKDRHDYFDETVKTCTPQSHNATA